MEGKTRSGSDYDNVHDEDVKVMIITNEVV